MDKSYTFSGHDSFECRQFWLKKGYDHVLAKKKFNDDAVVELGVGRNMVSAIRYWMKSFGLLEEKSELLTDFAHLIFADNGLDPYLEDEATLWLLHYKIVTTNYASLYSILFNEFRKQKPEFTKKHLFQFTKALKSDLNENTFGKDFETITKTYIPKGNEAEENYDGLLTDLNLIQEKNSNTYFIEASDRNSIPSSIILYCIAEQFENQKSISFELLMNEMNSVGVVFALTKDSLSDKLKLIAEDYRENRIVYSDNAGIRELQFKNGIPKKETILRHYYQTTHVA